MNGKELLSNPQLAAEGLRAGIPLLVTQLERQLAKQ
jgi:hypothetical protein